MVISLLVMKLADADASVERKLAQGSFLLAARPARVRCRAPPQPAGAPTSHLSPLAANNPQPPNLGIPQRRLFALNRSNKQPIATLHIAAAHNRP
jgi:hypothetical protein